MKDRDRPSRLTHLLRSALVLLLIVAIPVAAVLVAKGRHPTVVGSTKPHPIEQALDHPTARPHTDVPVAKAPSTGSIEVCGYGRLSTDTSDPGDVSRQIGVLAKGAQTRWLSALQDSSDLRARVAGLLLEGKVTGGESLRPVAERTLGEAVQLAVGSGDPAVYAMTMSMCTVAADADGVCRQLSLEHWATMDPDNAAPWLLIAGKARAQHDEAAEAAAFSHAAAAHKIDDYSDSLFAFAEAQLPQDVTPLERSYLAIEVIGVQSAVGRPTYSIAARHCPHDGMADDAARRECDSLAELLVTKGGTLLDLGVGTAIGERAGWSSERVKRLREQQHALMQVFVELEPPDSDGFWACDAVNHRNAYLTERVRIGELAAVRDMLERSGETVEAMAQRYAEHVESIRRDALGREQQTSAQPTQ
jgi:hypothetical protein